MYIIIKKYNVNINYYFRILIHSFSSPGHRQIPLRVAWLLLVRRVFVHGGDRSYDSRYIDHPYIVWNCDVYYVNSWGFLLFAFNI